MPKNSSWFQHRLQRGQQRLHALNIQCTSPILDLGSGDGVSTVLLSRLYPSSRIIAVDRQCSTLNQAQVHFSSIRNPVMGLLCADMQHLPFHENLFGTILLAFALHDSPYLPPFIQEIARIIRPAGILGVMEYHETYRAPWIRYPVRKPALIRNLVKNKFTKITTAFTEDRVYGLHATKSSPIK